MGATASQITGASIVYSTVCSGVQLQIKENLKAPHYWLLWREFTCDRWILSQSASNAEDGFCWRHYNLTIVSGPFKWNFHEFEEEATLWYF